MVDRPVLSETTGRRGPVYQPRAALRDAPAPRDTATILKGRPENQIILSVRGPGTADTGSERAMGSL